MATAHLNPEQGAGGGGWPRHSLATASVSSASAPTSRISQTLVYRVMLRSEESVLMLTLADKWEVLSLEEDPGDCFSFRVSQMCLLLATPHITRVRLSIGGLLFETMRGHQPKTNQSNACWNV